MCCVDGIVLNLLNASIVGGGGVQRLHINAG